MMTITLRADRPQLVPVGCLVNFDYHAHVRWVTLAPLGVMTTIFWLTVIQEAMLINDELHERISPESRLDFLGISSALAQRWPEMIPAR